MLSEVMRAKNLSNFWLTALRNVNLYTRVCLILYAWVLYECIWSIREWFFKQFYRMVDLGQKAKWIPTNIGKSFHLFDKKNIAKYSPMNCLWIVPFSVDFEHKLLIQLLFLDCVVVKWRLERKLMRSSVFYQYVASFKYTAAMVVQCTMYMYYMCASRHLNK